MNNKSNNNIISYTFFFFFLSLFIQNQAFCSIVISNGLTHIHKVEAGQVVREFIEIQNAGFQNRAIRVYQKDYSFTHDGAVFYDKPNTNQRSNANWIDFSPGYLELEPQQKSVINYEITIPEGQDLLGSYWSVLMVEGIETIAPALPQSGLSVATIMRYAIQIATNIGDSGENNLEFIEAKLEKVDGQKVGSVALINNGERLLIPEVSIELFDKEGQSVGVVKTAKKKIYPGTSARFFLALEDIPKGDYEAVVLADCTETDVSSPNFSGYFQNTLNFSGNISYQLNKKICWISIEIRRKYAPSI